uniref:Uncharacterized protein n=1 Tax=Sciurus vulgaris TaxID=55149 RepID=A0A8D2AYN5_SCIVU
VLVVKCTISSVQCNLYYNSVDNCIPLKSWPCKIQPSFNIHAFVPLRKYFFVIFVLQNYYMIQSVYRLTCHKRVIFLSFYFLLYRSSIFKQ